MGLEEILGKRFRVRLIFCLAIFSVTLVSSTHATLEFCPCSATPLQQRAAESAIQAVGKGSNRGVLVPDACGDLELDSVLVSYLDNQVEVIRSELPILKYERGSYVNVEVFKEEMEVQFVIQYGPASKGACPCFFIRSIGDPSSAVDQH